MVSEEGVKGPDAEEERAKARPDWTAVELKAAEIIRAFEKRRRRAVLISFLVAVVGAYLLYLKFTRFDSPDWALYTGIILLVSAYAFVSVLQDEFKDAFIPPLMEQFGFTYKRQVHSPNLEAVRPLLPPFSYTEGNDSYAGSYLGVRFSMVDIKTEKRIGSDRSDTIKTFEGRFAEIEAGQVVEPSILVRHDRGLIGRMDELVHDAGERVKLESSVFEKAFDVYCSDQLYARRILTPMMIESLTKLSRRFPGVRLLYEKNMIRVVLPDRSGPFEPGSFFFPVNEDLMRRFLDDIREVCELIDQLRPDVAAAPGAQKLPSSVWAR